MCFTYDDGYAECQQSETRKARKDHRCGCCKLACIHAGDQYEYRSGIFDGSPYSEKICRRCCFEIARIVAHELDEGCSWGESWPALDDVSEYLTDSGLGRTSLDAVPDLDMKAWPYDWIKGLRKAVSV